MADPTISNTAILRAMQARNFHFVSANPIGTHRKRGH